MKIFILRIRWCGIAATTRCFFFIVLFVLYPSLYYLSIWNSGAKLRRVASVYFCNLPGSECINSTRQSVSVSMNISCILSHPLFLSLDSRKRAFSSTRSDIRATSDDGSRTCTGPLLRSFNSKRFPHWPPAPLGRSFESLWLASHTEHNPTYRIPHTLGRISPKARAKTRWRTFSWLETPFADNSMCVCTLRYPLLVINENPPVICHNSLNSVPLLPIHNNSISV